MGVFRIEKMALEISKGHFACSVFLSGLTVSGGTLLGIVARVSAPTI